jgi:subtilisin family serine protease
MRSSTGTFLMSTWAILVSTTFLCLNSGTNAFSGEDESVSSMVHASKEDIINKNAKVWGLAGPDKYIISTRDHKESGSLTPKKRPPIPIAKAPKTEDVNFVVGAKVSSKSLSRRLKQYLPADAVVHWHQVNEELSILTVRADFINATNVWLANQHDIIYHDIQHETNHHVKWAEMVVKSLHKNSQGTPQHYQLTGQGVKVLMMDTGIDQSNPLFKHIPLMHKLVYSGVNAEAIGKMIDPNDSPYISLSLVDNGLKIEETDFDDYHNGHGTHVAGILVGSSPEAVSRAKLGVVDLDKGDQGGLTLPVSLLPLLETLYKAGYRVFSNSWGSESNYYTYRSMEFDTFMYLHDDAIVFFSAGNSGPDTHTVGSPSTAKNVISVGASQNHPLSFIHADPQTFYEVVNGSKGFLWVGDQENIADFSSRGPTADGRQKPDLVAPGEFICSARAHPIIGEAVSVLMRGTSMACPMAARICTQLLEYLSHNGHPAPTSAAVKAALVAMAEFLVGRSALVAYSAKRKGYIGAKTGRKLKSEDQGYGLIKLVESHLPFLFIEDRIPMFEYTKGVTRLYKATHEADINIVISWIDPPVVPYSKKVLVNDINLRVIVNDKQVYLGNNILDSVNNVEKVTIHVNRDDIVKVLIYPYGPITLLPPVKYQFVAMAIFHNFLAPLNQTIPDSPLDPPIPCKIASKDQLEIGAKVADQCVPKCPSGNLYYINGECQCIRNEVGECEDNLTRECVNGKLEPCPQLPKSKSTKSFVRKEKVDPVRRTLREAEIKWSWWWIAMWISIVLLMALFFYKRRSFK